MKQDHIAALQEVFNAYYGELYRFLLYTSDTGTDVGQALQRIFVQAYRVIPAYQGDVSYKTWLFAIALGQQKRSGRKQQVASQPLVESVELATEDEEDKRQRRIEQVHMAYQQLPQRERVVLALETVCGCSRADLSLILNLSESRSRTLADDALLLFQSKMDTEARAYIEEALVQQFAKPNDLELIDAKTNCWQAMLKQGRSAVLRKRWWPVAGIAVVALAVGVAVLLPGQFKDPMSPVLVVAKSDSEMITVPVLSQVTDQMKWSRIRYDYYQKSSYNLITTNQSDHYLDIVQDKDGNLYTVKWEVDRPEAEKKLLMNKMESALRVMGEGLAYRFLVTQTRSGKTALDYMYLFDMRDLTLTPLPPGPENSTIVNASIVEAEKPVAYYLAKNMLTQAVTLYSYNLATREEKSLYSADDRKKAVGFVARKSYVVLFSEKGIVLLADGQEKTIVQDELGASIISLENDAIFYEKGMRLDRNEFVYTPQRRVMRYDVKTGENRSLIPEEKGAQFPILASDTTKFLLGNFIPSQSIEGMTTHANLPGTLQFWEVADGKPAKLLFEQKTTWEQQLLQVRAVPDSNETQYNLTPQTGAEWSLLYDRERGTMRMQ